MGKLERLIERRRKKKFKLMPFITNQMKVNIITYLILLIVTFSCSNKKIIYTPDLKINSFGLDTNSSYCIVPSKYIEKYDTLLRSICGYLEKENIRIIIYNNFGLSKKELVFTVNPKEYTFDCYYEFGSDIEEDIIITPNEANLELSKKEFHIGDTILGKVYFRGQRIYDFGYIDTINIEVFGHFMSIIEREAPIACPFPYPYDKYR